MAPATVRNPLHGFRRRSSEDLSPHIIHQAGPTDGISTSLTSHEAWSKAQISSTALTQEYYSMRSHTLTVWLATSSAFVPAPSTSSDVMPPGPHLAPSSSTPPSDTASSSVSSVLILPAPRTRSSSTTITFHINASQFHPIVSNSPSALFPPKTSPVGSEVLSQGTVTSAPSNTLVLSVPTPNCEDTLTSESTRWNSPSLSPFTLSKHAPSSPGDITAPLPSSPLASALIFPTSLINPPAQTSVSSITHTSVTTLREPPFAATVPTFTPTDSLDRDSAAPDPSRLGSSASLANVPGTPAAIPTVITSPSHFEHGDAPSTLAVLAAPTKSTPESTVNFLLHTDAPHAAQPEVVILTSSAATTPTTVPGGSSSAPTIQIATPDGHITVSSLVADPTSPPVNFTASTSQKKVTVIAAVVGGVLAACFVLVMLIIIRRLRRSTMTGSPEKRSSALSFASHQGLLQDPPPSDLEWGVAAVVPPSYSATKPGVSVDRQRTRSTRRHRRNTSLGTTLTASTLGSGYLDAMHAVPSPRE